MDMEKKIKGTCKHMKDQKIGGIETIERLELNPRGWNLDRDA